MPGTQPNFLFPKFNPVTPARSQVQVRENAVFTSGRISQSISKSSERQRSSLKDARSSAAIILLISNSNAVI